MRRVFLASVVAVAITGLFSIVSSVWGACNPLGTSVCCETISCGSNVRGKKETWEVWFEPNYNVQTGFGYRSRDVVGSALVLSCESNCYPDFEQATVTHGTDSSGNPTWTWIKKVYNKDFDCNRINPPKEFRMEYTCRNLAEEEEACDSSGGSWNFSTNSCDFVGGGGCAQTCTPYQPLESGGCEGNVDYCAYPGAGCPSGFTDGGRGCCCGRGLTLGPRGYNFPAVARRPRARGRNLNEMASPLDP